MTLARGLRLYFDVKWSEWLEAQFPNAVRRVVLQGARIFFPEERAKEFNAELRRFWQGEPGARTQ